MKQQKLEKQVLSLQKENEALKREIEGLRRLVEVFASTNDEYEENRLHYMGYEFEMEEYQDDPYDDYESEYAGRRGW
jgi:predicted RNase H-like nuclease (RuvC/YqgF family)